MIPPEEPSFTFKPQYESPEPRKPKGVMIPPEEPSFTFKPQYESPEPRKPKGVLVEEEEPSFPFKPQHESPEPREPKKVMTPPEEAIYPSERPLHYKPQHEAPEPREPKGVMIPPDSHLFKPQHELSEPREPKGVLVKEEETNWLQDRSSDLTQYAERALVKSGVVTPEEKEFKSPPLLSKEEKFTEINSSQDSHWRSKKGDLISSHRNQFDATEGFIYNTVPSANNKNAPDKIQGSAVAHFFIMDDRPDWAKDVWDADQKNIERQSKWFKNQDMYKTQSEDNWIPVFNKVGNKLNVSYKKKDEIGVSDNVIQKLVQYKASDIDFSSKVGGSYDKGIFTLTTKDGKPIPSLPFINKKSYSRFSGSAPVFLFETKEGKKIARDYSGSILSIEKEIEDISKKYNISKSEITLGFYDAGSFSAKPFGNEKGELKRNQWSGFNTKGFAGSGVAFPVNNK